MVSGVVLQTSGFIFQQFYVMSGNSQSQAGDSRIEKDGPQEMTNDSRDCSVESLLIVAHLFEKLHRLRHKRFLQKLFTKFNFL